MNLSLNQQFSSQRFNFIYLLIATLIFAAANSVTRRLIDLGATHLVQGRNPISLCNVLFVGNLCALVILLSLYLPQRQRYSCKTLSRKDWLNLVIVSVLAGALGPGLIFSALDHTTVTNVVLVSRLEPLFGLGFSLIFFHQRISLWTLTGAVLTFLGIAVTALFASAGHPVIRMGNSMHLGLGELQAMAAALVLAIAGVINGSQLRTVPTGVIALVRTSLGTIIFFGLAISLYGRHHFVDAFSPFLWQWMLVYGGIIVVLGQLCWLAGLKTATVGQITVANAINPLLAIVLAYVILNERLTSAQLWGSGIVLTGVLFSAIGHWQAHANQTASLATKSRMFTGYQGV